MSPHFLTRLANGLFPHRWWFLAVAVLGMALLFAILPQASPAVAAMAGTLAGPLIALPWALLCACFWFHPVHGKLRPGSKPVGRLRSVVQLGIRWYAALFLTLFVVMSTVVWPALSLNWL